MQAEAKIAKKTELTRNIKEVSLGEEMFKSGSRFKIAGFARRSFSEGGLLVSWSLVLIFNFKLLASNFM